MKLAKVMTGLVIALSISSLTQCREKIPNKVPEPDTEVQSTVEVTYALQAITDIDMICSFVGENDLFPRFYMPSPDSEITGTSGTLTPIRDPNDDYLVVGYNRTKCFDGKLRDGTIQMNYGNNNPNARYYREYDFEGSISLLAYKSDGWMIQNMNGTPCLVTNLLNSPNYSNRTTKLSWLIDGGFEFIHPTDQTKNMTCRVKLIKTLANTDNPLVFATTQDKAINWQAARVEYSGEITGTTANAKPFTVTISANTPLIRDFTCYPDKVGGVLTEPVRTWNNEYHPFISGIATLKTGDAYPRQVYYGNENNPELPAQCDNSGVVMIKGISYKIDFLK